MLLQPRVCRQSITLEVEESTAARTKKTSLVSVRQKLRKVRQLDGE